MSSIAKIRLFQGDDGQTYYEPVAANGETLSTSEGYSRHEDALRAAADAYPGVEVEDQTEAG